MCESKLTPSVHIDGKCIIDLLNSSRVHLHFFISRCNYIFQEIIIRKNDLNNAEDIFK